MPVQSTFMVNSYHAIDAATGNVIPANANGEISLVPGQKVVFVDSDGDILRLQHFTIFATTDVKVAINDNDLYPWHIPASERRGLVSVNVVSITALNSCTLYYEGLCA